MTKNDAYADNWVIHPITTVAAVLFTHRHRYGRLRAYQVPTADFCLVSVIILISSALHLQHFLFVALLVKKMVDISRFSRTMIYYGTILSLRLGDDILVTFPYWSTPSSLNYTCT